MNETVDVVVIGGGPGGYSAAIRLAQHGFQVVCVERESFGGVCLNWGCVPSKALITVAERYGWLGQSASFGIDVAGVRLDLARAQARSRGIVRHHTDGVRGLLRGNGVRSVQGSARLDGPRRVVVRSEGGGVTRFDVGRAIVLATGARVRTLPGVEFDGARIVSAREAVFFEELPEHLLVIGGGVIGLELGSAYQKLGSRLTVVERGPELLPGVDRDLVRLVAARLQKSGARLLLGTDVRGAQRSTDGVSVEIVTPDGAGRLGASHVLVAVGFVPDTSELGLESAGVALDGRGHIATDDSCRTTAPGVYALGDVAGPPYLAHKAYKEAEVVSDRIAGRRATRDWRALPAAIFTDPEIATVGLDERSARAAGPAEVRIGKFPFAALGRAMALGKAEGFVKLIAHGDRLVGAAVVGPEASELIAELAVCLEMGATLEDLALIVHAHPTLAEAVREAADQALGRSVHVLNGARRASALSTAGRPAGGPRTAPTPNPAVAVPAAPDPAVPVLRARAPHPPESLPALREQVLPGGHSE